LKQYSKIDTSFIKDSINIT